MVMRIIKVEKFALIPISRAATAKITFPTVLGAAEGDLLNMQKDS